jgi:hypothetical protein
MRASLIRTGAVLSLGLCLSLGTARADYSITVLNPSFEILPGGGLPDGCGVGCSYSVAPIPGWTNTGTSGQFQPGSSSGNFAYFNAVPNGLTVAYSNGGTITQTVGPTVQAGQTYTLNVWLGNRNDGYDGQGSAALVLDYGTPSATTYLASGTPAPRGEFSLFTATFTGTALTAGDTITIDLIASGAQGDFDNVSLSATPEPALYGILGLGLVGLLVAVRRWKIA